MAAGVDYSADGVKVGKAEELFVVSDGRGRSHVQAVARWEAISGHGFPEG